MASVVPATMAPQLSPSEIKEAQEQVFQDTMALAREKFATMTREEQSATAARIAAIEIS